MYHIYRGLSPDLLKEEIFDNFNDFINSVKKQVNYLQVSICTKNCYFSADKIFNSITLSSANEINFKTSKKDMLDCFTLLQTLSEMTRY